jgi:microcystin-dependent protein
MAYNVDFTDNINKGSITVEDNSINTETSLSLLGRNLQDFGAVLNEDLLHLLENFANNTSPSNPVEGQLWYDTTTGVDQLKIYDGAQWVSAGGLKKATSEPEASASTVGDLWVDTANSQVYVYTGSGYVLVGPDYSEGASTGAKFEQRINSNNISENVIVDTVNNVPVAITAQTEFNLKRAETGFAAAASIKKGINLASDAKLYGTATSAETLVVNNNNIASANFARKDTANNFAEGQNILNNTGLAIGENGLLRLSITGSTAIIRHTANDGTLDFKVNQSGTTRTAMRITPDLYVGIANEAPQEALDVTGNAKISGTLEIGSSLQSESVSDGAVVVPGGLAVAKRLNVGGDIASQNIAGANISPLSNNSYDIGSTSLAYRNVYATDFYGNLTGNITGTAASATIAGKLSSPTTFEMTGDVTATSFTFDGQLGGTTKTFTTSISDSFITGQTDTTTIASTDKILIARTDGELYNVTQEKLVSTVPTFFLGQIMPYAGQTLPAEQTSWALCHGQELNIAEYGALFDILGYTYGGNTGLTFRLPDLRGRQIVGYVPTGVTFTDQNRIFDDGATSVFGATAGRESDWITKDQLPDHEHNFTGDAGNGYLALTNAGTGTDTGASANSLLGNTAGYGIDRTGSVQGVTFSTETIDSIAQDVGNKFSVTSPSVVMNYIIYIGPIAGA